MEAVDRIPAPVTAALDTETGIITFHCPGFNDSSTSSDLVNCSQLLTDLLTNSSTDAGEESVHLPVTWESLQLWLRYASKPNCQQFDKASSSDVGAGDALVVNEEAHSATIQPGLFKEDRSSSIGTSIPIETLCTLLNVSDILIDEWTQAQCIGVIVEKIKKPGIGAVLCPALHALPEHLQLSVLSNVPLAHSFAHLPAGWHPTCLRAHRRSVDASSTLHLPRLPIHSIYAAIKAATRLPHIQDLALAGLTFPHEPAPSIHLLGELTGLTALNLHDTGIREPAMNALADVLPCMRNLLSLDLSSNLLRTPVAAALAPALAECTCLQHLNLLKTLSAERGDETVIARLADALERVTRLTSVSIGLAAQQLRSEPEYIYRASIPACTVFVEHLARCGGLRHLRLEVFGSAIYWPEHRALGVALGQLTTLQSLHCTVPRVSPYAAEMRIGWGLTRLTSLRLDVLPNVQDADENYDPEMSQASHADATLGRLVYMRCLRSLDLALPLDYAQPGASAMCATLASALAHSALSQLSSMRVRAVPLLQNDQRVPQPHAPYVFDIVQAAVSMSALQTLHVPVCTARSTVLKRLVAALLQAGGCGVASVSVDMFIYTGRGESAEGGNAGASGAREDVVILQRP